MFENPRFGRIERERERRGGMRAVPERVVKGKWTVINSPKTKFHNLCYSVNIKKDLQEVGYRVWTGSSWLRIGTGDGHL